MDMKFGAWNVRSMYRVVAGENTKYVSRISYWECRRSDGMEVTPNQQVNIHFSVEGGMRIMN
jgi:hypothetical protein